MKTDTTSIAADANTSQVQPRRTEKRTR